MLDLNSLIPGAGRRWRELWLPELINGTFVPRCMPSGHPLTMTGSRKGSSVNGLRFNGALANSAVNCGALYNGSAKWWVSLRFKLDNLSTLGTLVRKSAAGNFIELWRSPAAPDAIRYRHYSGGAYVFAIAWPGPFVAGVWYHVLASAGQAIGGGAGSDGARLRLNNGVALTNADVTALPAGGTFWIGDEASPGTGSGVRGSIADVVMGNDDLTAVEETALYYGVPPSDAVNFWPLDEGVGVVAYDRGSGGNNGTIGADAVWDYDARKLPALSNDGINDRAVSSSGVDIGGGATLVVVKKGKTTQNTALASSSIVLARLDASNYLKLWHPNGANGVRFSAYGAGAGVNLSYAVLEAIDSYYIHIGSLTTGGDGDIFVNGAWKAGASGVGVMGRAGATVHIGATNVPDEFNLDKILLVGLIDGALFYTESRALSRALDRRMGLGIGV